MRVRVEQLIALLLAAAAAWSPGAMAGPFGLAEGQRPGDLSLGENVAPGHFMLMEAPSPHPELKEYLVRLGANSGLCSVIGYTPILGNEASGKLAVLLGHLEGKYGLFGDQPKSGARKWVTSKPENWDGVESITLFQSAGRVGLGYRFSNYGDCEFDPLLGSPDAPGADVL